jgi:LGFP repeat
MIRSGRLAIAAVCALTLACGKQEAANPSARLAVNLAVVDMTTPIGTKYDQSGGATTLGAPMTEVLSAPSGDLYQRFEKGVIVQSMDWGAVLVTNALFDKWLALRSSTTASGQDLFMYIGPPIADATTTAGIEKGAFARGMIFAQPAGSTAFAVSGEVYRRYADVAGSLGLPTSEEIGAAGGGRMQSFQYGDVYWLPGSPAHEVLAAIRTRWLELGGPAGELGYPTTNEAPIIRDGTEIGRASRFAFGTIYDSPSTGAWEVKSTIAAAYESLYAGASGWLGLPVGPSGQTAAGTQYTDFQNGMLVQQLGLPTVWAFGSLEIYWQRMQGYGRDCALGVCGAQDIYVHIWSTTPSGTVHTRIPASGNWSGGGEINQSWPLAQVVQHDFFLELQIHGWDSDVTSGDDSLGWVRVSYDVDNLFGILDGGVHHGADGGDSFDITFGTRNPIPYDTSDFVGNLGWSFANPTTPRLSYAQFAATFRDVDPDEYAWRHPFNRLYYELIYKSLAKGGNCFGMSLTTTFAQKNELVWAEPVFRFPELDGIVNEVNIKHGFQIGGAAIDWFLLQFVSGATHDPKGVFEATRAAAAAGDYPVLGLTTNYLVGGFAHAVRPYRWEKAPGLWTMAIYDNNRPGTERVIAIDPDRNTFKYESYSGGEWSGGRMFYYPFRILDGTPRTPFDEIAMLVGQPFLVVLGDSGHTVQVTDSDGRTFYDATPGGPTLWEDIRADGARVPDLARVPTLAATGAASAEIYFGRSVGRSYKYQVGGAPGVLAGTPYEWSMSTATLSADVVVPATPGVPDILAANNLETPQKAISIQVPSDGTVKSLAWTVAGAVKQRWAEMKNVRLVPGQTITIRLANAGYEMVIDNDGPTTSGELTVHSGPGATPVSAGTVVIPGGQATVQFRTPVTSMTYSGGTPGNDGWLRSAVTVTLEARDFSGTGIAYLEYEVDQGPWTPYSAPFPYAEEGVTTLSYRARDRASNLEKAKSQVFKIDTRLPLVTASVGGPVRARTDAFVMHFTAEDPVPGSGLAGVVARLDGSLVQDGQAIDLLWIALGTHTLVVSAADLAGWQAETNAGFELVATLGSLRDVVLALRARGEIDSDGVMTSLIAKVPDPSAGESSPSIANRLAALDSSVRAQAGKHITARAADLLVADIGYVKQHLP